MESPPYLFEQYAKRHGLSKESAKIALLLKAYAEQGKSLRDARALIGLQKDRAQRICRKMLIDFSDYHPYANLEKKGLPRPVPGQRDIAKPASELPLFT